MSPQDQIVHPVLLSGGSGTRLWPLSRALYPKQLLQFDAEEPLLLQTARRVQGERFSAPLRSDEHTSELQPLMRSSYAGFCLKKKNNINHNPTKNQHETLHTC